MCVHAGKLVSQIAQQAVQASCTPEGKAVHSELRLLLR